MVQRQINWQVSFNPKNRSHRELMDWIDEQTTNRSSFIRETLVMRMLGMSKTQENVGVFNEFSFDQDEIIKLIEV